MAALTTIRRFISKQLR